MQDDTSPPAGTASRRKVLIKGIATLMLVLCIGLATYVIRSVRAVKRTPVPIGIDINQEVKKLVGKRRTVPLVVGKAVSVQTAIKNGDYATANKLLKDALAQSHFQGWRFYPFGELVSNLQETNDPAYEQRVTDWIAKDKNSAIPYLVRAEYYYNIGWRQRGTRFARETQYNHMYSFDEYMNKALADADTAISLNDTFPSSYHVKLRILAGIGNTPAMEKAFREAITKYPSYYPFYERRLSSLEPKWGGSVQELYGFVDKYGAKTSNTSPLRLLYLTLYAELFDAANMACYSPDSDGRKQCTAAALDKLITPKLESDVQTALDLYKYSDRHQFDLAVDGLLTSIVEIPGGEAFSGKLLQQAAQIMGSDNQLDDKNPGHNNYVLDKVTADVWRQGQFYENSERKYKEAILDLKSDPFPDEAENDVALAQLYYDLADLYDRMSRFAEVITYTRAAETLSGTVSYRVCESYYWLRHYDEAIQECTKVLAITEDDHARMRRAGSYEQSGKLDAALQDFAVLADSESEFRNYAAIEMSVT